VLSSGAVSARRLQVAALLVGLAALVVVLASATLVDRRAPFVERISLSRPSGNERVALTHSTIDVLFSEPVQRRSAESRFKMEPSVDGSLSWDGDRTLIFTPDPKFDVAKEFRVSIDRGFADLAGNVNDTAPDAFVFRTVGLPTLASTDPPDGKNGIPLDQPIRLTFDRLMDTELTEGALQVEPAARLRVAWSGSTLIVTPADPLAPGTLYRLEVGDDAADTDGNRLGSPISVSFTTVSLGLGVTRVAPASGSAGTALSAPIAVVFDAPIDAASVANSITLTPSVSGQIRAVPLPSDSGGATSDLPWMITFQPDAPLAPHTTYTVELRDGAVRAQASASAAKGRTWSYTTGSAPEALQNQVLFLSDRGGVQNVWAMNPDGTNQHQLTGELAPVSSFDVSGDGRTLVYAAAGVVRTLALPAGRVAVLSAPEVADYAPRLVPDGSAVILGRRERLTGRDDGYWLVPLGGDASAARVLLPAGAPPLGSTSSPGALPGSNGAPGPWTPLAAVSGDSQLSLIRSVSGELVRVPLRGDPVAQPTGLRDPAGPASWSSARGGFLVSAVRALDGARGTWVVSPSGTPAPGASPSTWPVISVTGATLSIGGDPPQQLEYRSSWFGQPVRLTPDGDLVDRQPSFSPRGDAALFVRVPSSTPARSAGIWRVGVDGSGLRQLSPDGSDPRWLP
jgi:Big-like domain-containing protein